MSRNKPIMQPSSATPFEQRYNELVQKLRDGLLKYGGDALSKKSIIHSIFKRVDENDSGIVSVQEMKDFVLSSELELFDDFEDPSNERYCNLLLEQMDMNRDGIVGISELEIFLWPSHKDDNSDFREMGVVIEYARKATMRQVSSVAAAGSAEAILFEFASLAKVSVKQGSSVPTKFIRLAFQNLHITEFNRVLAASEVDLLIDSLDGNHDGSISATEFKDWLFPGIKLKESSAVAAYLQNVIKTYFEGDVRAFYEDFKSHGIDGIHKGDFVTSLKALDNSITRHEASDLAGKLAASDKIITYARLTDIIGSMGQGSPRSPRGSPRSPRSGGENSSFHPATPPQNIYKTNGTNNNNSRNNSRNNSINHISPRASLTAAAASADDHDHVLEMNTPNTPVRVRKTGSNSDIKQPFFGGDNDTPIAAPTNSTNSTNNIANNATNIATNSTTNTTTSSTLKKSPKELFKRQDAVYVEAEGESSMGAEEMERLHSSISTQLFRENNESKLESGYSKTDNITEKSNSNIINNNSNYNGNNISGNNNLFSLANSSGLSLKSLSNDFITTGTTITAGDLAPVKRPSLGGLGPVSPKGSPKQLSSHHKSLSPLGSSNNLLSTGSTGTGSGNMQPLNQLNSLQTMPSPDHTKLGPIVTKNQHPSPTQPPHLTQPHMTTPSPRRGSGNAQHHSPLVPTPPQHTSPNGSFVHHRNTNHHANQSPSESKHDPIRRFSGNGNDGAVSTAMHSSLSADNLEHSSNSVGSVHSTGNTSGSPKFQRKNVLMPLLPLGGLNNINNSNNINNNNNNNSNNNSKNNSTSNIDHTDDHTVTSNDHKTSSSKQSKSPSNKIASILSAGVDYEEPISGTENTEDDLTYTHSSVAAAAISTTAEEKSTSDLVGESKVEFSEQKVDISEGKSDSKPPSEPNSGRILEDHLSFQMAELSVAPGGISNDIITTETTAATVTNTTTNNDNSTASADTATVIASNKPTREGKLEEKKAVSLEDFGEASSESVTLVTNVDTLFDNRLYSATDNADNFRFADTSIAVPPGVDTSIATPPGAATQASTKSTIVVENTSAVPAVAVVATEAAAQQTVEYVSLPAPATEYIQYVDTSIAVPPGVSPPTLPIPVSEEPTTAVSTTVSTTVPSVLSSISIASQSVIDESVVAVSDHKVVVVFPRETERDPEYVDLPSDKLYNKTTTSSNNNSTSNANKTEKLEIVTDNHKINRNNNNNNKNNSNNNDNSTELTATSINHISDNSNSAEYEKLTTEAAARLAAQEAATSLALDKLTSETNAEKQLIREVLFGNKNNNSINRNNSSNSSVNSGGSYSGNKNGAHSDFRSPYSPQLSTAGIRNLSEISAELGYQNHTGKYRGFPFDTFTCCNTADLICPAALTNNSKNNNNTYNKYNNSGTYNGKNNWNGTSNSFNTAGSASPVPAVQQPSMMFGKLHPESIKHAYNNQVVETKVRTTPTVSTTANRNKSMNNTLNNTSRSNTISKNTTSKTNNYYNTNNNINSNIISPSAYKADQSTVKKSINPANNNTKQGTKQLTKPVPSITSNNRSAKPHIPVHQLHSTPHRVPIILPKNNILFNSPADQEFESHLVSLAVNDADLLHNIKRTEKLRIDTHKYTDKNINNNIHENDHTEEENDHGVESYNYNTYHHYNSINYTNNNITSNNNNNINNSNSDHLQTSNESVMQDKNIELLEAYEQRLTQQEQELHETLNHSQQFTTQYVNQNSNHNNNNSNSSGIVKQIRNNSDNHNNELNNSVTSVYSEAAHSLEEAKQRADKHKLIVDKALQLIDHNQQHKTHVYEATLQSLQQEIEEIKQNAQQKEAFLLEELEKRREKEEFLSEEVEKYRQSVESLEETLQETETVVAEKIKFHLEQTQLQLTQQLKLQLEHSQQQQQQQQPPVKRDVLPSPPRPQATKSRPLSRQQARMPPQIVQPTQQPALPNQKQQQPAQQQYYTEQSQPLQVTQFNITADYDNIHQPHSSPLRQQQQNYDVRHQDYYHIGHSRNISHNSGFEANNSTAYNDSYNINNTQSSPNKHNKHNSNNIHNGVNNKDVSNQLSPLEKKQLTQLTGTDFTSTAPPTKPAQHQQAELNAPKRSQSAPQRSNIRQTALNPNFNVFSESIDIQSSTGQNDVVNYNPNAGSSKNNISGNNGSSSSKLHMSDLNLPVKPHNNSNRNTNSNSNNALLHSQSQPNTARSGLSSQHQPHTGRSSLPSYHSMQHSHNSQNSQNSQKGSHLAPQSTIIPVRDRPRDNSVPWVPSSQNVRNCYNKSDEHSPHRRRPVEETKLNLTGSLSVLSQSGSYTVGGGDNNSNSGRKRSQSAPPARSSTLIPPTDPTFVPIRDRPKENAVPWVPSSQNVRNCYNKTDEHSPHRRRPVEETKLNLTGTNVGGVGGVGNMDFSMRSGSGGQFLCDSGQHSIRSGFSVGSGDNNSVGAHRSFRISTHSNKVNKVTPSKINILHNNSNTNNNSRDSNTTGNGNIAGRNNITKSVDYTSHNHNNNRNYISAVTTASPQHKNKNITNNSSINNSINSHITPQKGTHSTSILHNIMDKEGNSPYFVAPTGKYDHNSPVYGQNIRDLLSQVESDLAQHSTTTAPFSPTKFVNVRSPVRQNRSAVFTGDNAHLFGENYEDVAPPTAAQNAGFDIIRDSAAESQVRATQDEWWQYIQEQKKKHEKMGYEAGLLKAHQQ